MKIIIISIAAIALSACSAPHTAKQNNLAKTAELSEPITVPAVMDETISSFVEDGHVAGYSVVVYENDVETYYGEAGLADIDSNAPMKRDTIHSIYSMTKPIVSVALMTLYEQDKFELDDPLSKHLPEFKDMRVYAGDNEKGEPIMVSPEKPITVLDMLRHTAGLPESFWGGPDTESKVFGTETKIGIENTLNEMAKAGGSLPLLFQPGTQWRYSWAVDMQSLMIERLSGKPVERYLQEVLFDPLGMTDTSYYVPTEKQHRLATIYTKAENGDLEKNTDQFTHDLHRKPHVMKPGSLGLASTVDDFAQFARMLGNKGELNGVRILKPETVSLMTDDHLPSNLADKSFLGNRGFGIGFAIRLVPPQKDKDLYGHIGEYRWGGAAGTNFWVDPEKNIVVVIMTQRMPFDGKLNKEIRDAIYNVRHRSLPNSDDNQ